jgi:hypothetical protein
MVEGITLVNTRRGYLKRGKGTQIMPLLMYKEIVKLMGKNLKELIIRYH